MVESWAQEASCPALSAWLQVKLHDIGCCLKAYRADLVRSLRLYGELHRFLPALAAMEGASVCELPVSGSYRASVLCATVLVVKPAACVVTRK